MTIVSNASGFRITADGGISMDGEVEVSESFEVKRIGEQLDFKSTINKEEI